MTYKEMCARLETVYGSGEGKAVARCLLEDAFHLSLTDIVCGAVERLSPADTARLQSMMERLENAEPVQYVTGQAPFCGRTFSVRPGVLIPRPETERLCQMAVSSMKVRSLPTALDICTGSGCIAVTMALDMPEASVEAWDISPHALSVARENAERLGAKVGVVCQDALSAPPHSERWDVIVSNPPYICTKERAQMEDNVLRYEPHMALFVPDSDPLLFYRAIARYASRALTSHGTLLFEINPIYADDTADMLRATGFTSVSIGTDDYGRQRYATAKKE